MSVEVCPSKKMKQGAVQAAAPDRDAVITAVGAATKFAGLSRTKSKDSVESLSIS